MWRLILDFVRNLNSVILQVLPSFWKVAKGYMEGKYQKVCAHVDCIAKGARITV